MFTEMFSHMIQIASSSSSVSTKEFRNPKGVYRDEVVNTYNRVYI